MFLIWYHVSYLVSRFLSCARYPPNKSYHTIVDCAIAHLWKDNMKWYDAPCSIRGFLVLRTIQNSLNPLCEHEPFQRKPFKYFVEGSNQDWVSIGLEKYKFIKTPYGVTRDEAEEICKENGGFLANIKSEEERWMIEEHYLKYETGQPKSYFLIALDFLTGTRITF